MKKKCVICGFDRVVDRAHLIPRKVCEGIVGMKKYLTYEGKHIVILCRNHHFLFDNHRLTDEEKAILLPYYDPVMIDLLKICNSAIKPKNKSAQKNQKRKEKMLRKWAVSLVGTVLKVND